MATGVLLADDHGMFPTGRQALLQSEKVVEVVGAASTGEEAVERITAAVSERTKKDSPPTPQSLRPS